jgi:hypothetical protein
MALGRDFSYNPERLDSEHKRHDPRFVHRVRQRGRAQSGRSLVPARHGDAQRPSEKRDPFGLMCVNDAMAQDAFGPLTLRCGGRRLMIPTASRTRGLVSCSSSIRTSQKAGSSETRSNRSVGGYCPRLPGSGSSPCRGRSGSRASIRRCRTASRTTSWTCKLTVLELSPNHSRLATRSSSPPSRWQGSFSLEAYELRCRATAAIFTLHDRTLLRPIHSVTRSSARRFYRSWSSSSAIRLRPHRSGRAAFPHPALPGSHPHQALRGVQG